MINFAAELEKQREAQAAGNAASDAAKPTGLTEYKLAEGVYFQEFRDSQGKKVTKDELFEVHQPKKNEYVPPENPIILNADFKEFEKRIKKMIESIEEIQEVEDWIDDADFRDAVQENYEVIERNYENQLAIISALARLDPCCDFLKKQTIPEIEKGMEVNKDKQSEFLKQLLGYNQKSDSKNVAPENTHDQEGGKEEQGEEEQEEEEEEIMSMQQQIKKDEEEGMYL